MPIGQNILFIERESAALDNVKSVVGEMIL